MPWQKHEVWVSAKTHNNGHKVGEEELENHLEAGFEPYAVHSNIHGTIYYLKREWKYAHGGRPKDNLGFPAHGKYEAPKAQDSSNKDGS